MSYVLENEGEASRLEYQSTLPAYDLKNQLRFLSPKPENKILDAGCGSGLLGRYILDNFHNNIQIEACDFSEIRIQQAKNLSKDYKQIKYFQSNLENLPVKDNTYDIIICRYVWEHLENVQAVSDEFYRALKVGGMAYIIDLDGILFNLHSENKKLNNYLDLLKKGLKFDLHIGRKIPSYLQKSGFVDITWEVNALGFQNESLQEEYKLYQDRLQFARPVLNQILGDETDEFFELYLNELLIPGTLLFMNQFISLGKKLK